MAVVDAETVKGGRKSRHVAFHVIPQPRVVCGTVAVAQLHAVAPDDDFAAEVRLGGQKSEILQGISVPYPAVVSEKEGTRVVIRSLRIVWQTCEVSLDKWEPVYNYMSDCGCKKDIESLSGDLS